MKNLICKVSSLKIKVFVLLVVLIFTNIPASFAADELYKKIEENRKKYDRLLEEASYYHDVIENRKLWFVTTPCGQFFMRRYDLIKYLTWAYIMDLKRRGEKFHKKELAERIKMHRDTSNEMKKGFEKSVNKLFNMIDKERVVLEEEYTALSEKWRRTRKEKVPGSEEEKDWQDWMFDKEPMGKKDKEMFGGAAGSTPAEKK